MCIRRKLRTACAIIEEADGTTRIEQRQFGAFKRDRRALAKWAAALLPDQVVMESTGIYDQCTNPCRLVVARFDARLLEGLASQRNALALLQTLPNVDLIGAAMLLVEIGSNMDAFGSADRLASWVGICRATTSRQGSVNQVVSAKAISMSEGFFANSRMPPAAPRLSSSQSSRR
jgi:transposase